MSGCSSAVWGSGDSRGLRPAAVWASPVQSDPRAISRGGTQDDPAGPVIRLTGRVGAAGPGECQNPSGGSKKHDSTKQNTTRPHRCDSHSPRLGEAMPPVHAEIGLIGGAMNPHSDLAELGRQTMRPVQVPPVPPVPEAETGRELWVVTCTQCGIQTVHEWRNGPRSESFGMGLAEQWGHFDPTMEAKANRFSPLACTHRSLREP